MTLYLGNIKRKIVLDGAAYCLNAIVTTSSIDNIRLLSADNYILKDSNGVYLTIKEDE